MECRIKEFYLRSSTECGGCCIRFKPFLAQAKVSQDNVALGVQKDVLWLKISMIRQTDSHHSMTLIFSSRLQNIA